MVIFKEGKAKFGAYLKPNFWQNLVNKSCILTICHPWLFRVNKLDILQHVFLAFRANYEIFLKKSLELKFRKVQEL